MLRLVRTHVVVAADACVVMQAKEKRAQAIDETKRHKEREKMYAQQRFVRAPSPLLPPTSTAGLGIGIVPRVSLMHVRGCCVC